MTRDLSVFPSHSSSLPGNLDMRHPCLISTKMKLLSPKLLPGEAHTQHERRPQHQTPTCPLPLVAFPSLLVASPGGLLLKRLLERLEDHMEDTHCSESAMKTQITRKISMPGHRVLQNETSGRRNFTMVCISPRIVPWFVCVTHGLLHPGIVALPLPVHKGSHYSLFFLLSCFTLRGRTSCTWSLAG